MEVILVAVNNHLVVSAILCQKACWALLNIVRDSKENAGLLIALGGGAAVAKIRTQWPDSDDVRYHVRRLANSIASEMDTWADDEEERRN
jgi:hypothetical protein